MEISKRNQGGGGGIVAIINVVFSGRKSIEKS